MSITCIENLSNELFYAIFDYLDGCDIYNSFSNLNNHFQQLLYRSSFLFKIIFYSTPDEIFINKYKQVIYLNKHQILSLNLWLESPFNQFFSTFNIDSSLDHLESLILKRIERETLLLLLNNLTCLSRLNSLTIESFHTSNDLTDIYRLIFTLPKLKYIKLISNHSNSSISLPISTNQQLNTIKHLVIDHCCTFNELAAILSYTPQLANLYLVHTYDNDPNIGIILPMTLANLRNISIEVYSLKFDEILEIFMEKISWKLKSLRFIIRSKDISYLDADLWEQLILQYLPDLQKFYLKYCENIDDEDIDYERESIDDYLESNQFTSLFWIERQWIFEAEIYFGDITYSIHPYTKRWNESISSFSLLTLKDIPFNEYPDLLIQDITRVLNVTPIYHLQIPKDEICISALLEILYLLPDLDSLKISYLSLSQPMCFLFEEVPTFHSISNRNNITKVYLEKMSQLEEIYCLIKLCPRMNYLQIGCTNTTDIELLVRSILLKPIARINHLLRSLCICISMANDEMVKKLKNRIDSEKLLFNYIIERVLDKIYLQWK